MSIWRSQAPAPPGGGGGLRRPTFSRARESRQRAHLGGSPPVRLRDQRALPRSQAGLPLRTPCFTGEPDTQGPSIPSRLARPCRLSPYWRCRLFFGTDRRAGSANRASEVRRPAPGRPPVRARPGPYPVYPKALSGGRRAFRPTRGLRAGGSSGAHPSAPLAGSNCRSKAAALGPGGSLRGARLRTRSVRRGGHPP